MVLRESKGIESRRNPLDVKTARKWEAETDIDVLLSSLSHHDMVSATQSHRKGLVLGTDRLRPFASMMRSKRKPLVSNRVKRGKRASFDQMRSTRTIDEMGGTCC